MTNQNLIIFENFNIRRHYDEKSEIWYFSVIDIIAALTDQRDYQRARNYWNKLAQRLREEGNETVTNCQRLKLKTQDRKEGCERGEFLACAENKEGFEIKKGLKSSAPFYGKAHPKANLSLSGNNSVSESVVLR